MFEFLKKMIPFLNKDLNLSQMATIRKEVETELDKLPSKARSVTLLIKVGEAIPERLAEVYLDQLAQEYSRRLNKKIFLTYRK